MSHHDAFFQHLVVQKHSLKIITNSKKHLAHLEDNVQDSLQSLDLVKVCFEGMNIKLKNGIWCKPIITVLNDQGADSICAFMSAKECAFGQSCHVLTTHFAKLFSPAHQCVYAFTLRQSNTNCLDRIWKQIAIPNLLPNSEFRFSDTELRFSDTKFRFSDTELRFSDTMLRFSGT